MSPRAAAILVAIVTLSGLVSFGIWAIRDYGSSQYEAGYTSRSNEVAEAARLAQIESDRLQRAQNERTNELEHDLRASRERSEALAARIRDSDYLCPDLGAQFVELFNAGSEGGVRPDGLEARPASGS